MSGFIQKAACSGRRPVQLANLTGYQRGDLVSYLLRERNVARFVVAPTGYGKTHLIANYADTVFSWLHVFWINGKSPCFLRDLDQEAIAENCKRLDKGVQLVVFEDVPVLEADRAKKLSRQIDALLTVKCEVIVSCTPCCDVFGSLQRDRLRIDASMLLLSDEELDDARTSEDRMRTPTVELGGSHRVAALAWPVDATAPTRFLKDALQEQMPSDLMIVMVCMFALGQGKLDTLRLFCEEELETVQEIVRDYPHLSFDDDADRFQTPRIGVDDIAAGLRQALRSVVEHSTFETREDLVLAWADALADEECGFGRACDLVRTVCPAPFRARWMAARALQLAQAACFYEGMRLSMAIRAATKGTALADRQVCVAFEAVCNMLFGDEAKASKYARRLAFDELCQPDARICCLLVLARCGLATVKERATAKLAGLAQANKDKRIDEMTEMTQLAVSWYATENATYFATWWSRLEDEGASDKILGLTASWLFSALASRVGIVEEPMAVDRGGVRKAELFVRARTAAEPDGQPFDFFILSAGLSLERALSKGAAMTQGPLPAATLLALRRAEMTMVSQKMRFLKEVQGGSVRGAGSYYDHAKAMPGEDDFEPLHQVPERIIPILDVKLFGRLEVKIGDQFVDEGLFCRKHVRMLLLVLSLNLGRDISRASLSKMLWPESSADAAMGNLYAAWSKLRRALSLPDGSCPYLERRRYGCGLRKQYVKCDISRFNEICRELMFGKPDAKGWAALYDEIEKEFGNDLLPSEDDEPVVELARAEYRTRLVDALVGAAGSIIETENYKLALWFSRCAIGHDETREDAYVMLMRAQIACKQRTSAMMTYHQCRRVLAETLGVDPSPETNALYESLLDTGE